MKVIIFLGAPGSGKGTQSDMLVSREGFIKISTGDLLREVSASGTEFGNELRKIMSSGGLVSDEIVARILKEKMAATGKDSANFIFDGFPRTLNQASILEDIISKMDQDNLSVDVVLLKINEQLVVDRISGRFSCGDCKESYHDIYKKTKTEGICDVCGSSNMQRREDDKRDVVINRIAQYNAEIQPIIEFYQKLYEIKEIKAEKGYEEVYQDITNSVNI